MQNTPDDHLPENDTEVHIYLTNPRAKLKDRYRDGVFHIDNHWGLKQIDKQYILMWDYVGQWS